MGISTTVAAQLGLPESVKHRLHAESGCCNLLFIMVACHQ